MEIALSFQFNEHAQRSVRNSVRFKEILAEITSEKECPKHKDLTPPPRNKAEESYDSSEPPFRKQKSLLFSGYSQMWGKVSWEKKWEICSTISRAHTRFNRSVPYAQLSNILSQTDIHWVSDWNIQPTKKEKRQRLRCASRSRLETHKCGYFFL